MAQSGALGQGAPAFTCTLAITTPAATAHASMRSRWASKVSVCDDVDARMYATATAGSVLRRATRTAWPPDC